MVEAVRRREERRIWISRGQLSALALTTLFIAVLAFFVGLRVGQDQAGAPAPTASPVLLPDPQKEDALEELLRQVEVAQGGAALSFPDALTRDVVPPVPTASAAGATLDAVVSPPHVVPPAPESMPPLPVQEGWSVQVGSYENPEEAEALLQQVSSAGWPAYRVATLVGGQSWHRVRVGGYPTKEAASAAGVELATSMGVEELMISRAP